MRVRADSRVVELEYRFGAGSERLYRNFRLMLGQLGDAGTVEFGPGNKFYLVAADKGAAVPPPPSGGPSPAPSGAKIATKRLLVVVDDADRTSTHASNRSMRMLLDAVSTGLTERSFEVISPMGVDVGTRVKQPTKAALEVTAAIPGGARILLVKLTGDGKRLGPGGAASPLVARAVLRLADATDAVLVWEGSADAQLEHSCARDANCLVDAHGRLARSILASGWAHIAAKLK
ncbi:MAG TPA: hypothetical protein PK264_16290 [Hyphomicrobiaceae bacterium]|nr:hypothetical protein [Hyphomicrobiaceae bacterium]